MTTALDRYAEFLGNLSVERLAELPDVVAEDVFFRDPFNEVTGAHNMQRAFLHMYETLGDVRFDILHKAMIGETGLLHWRFTSQFRGKPWIFEGMSKVTLNQQGLVSSHIDHWDAARDFYEMLPLIGWVVRKIRHRIALK